MTLNILFLFVLFQSSAQNLVPNPSFEIYDTCPQSWNQMSRVVDWSDASTGTTDYFNSCGSNNFSVPNNVCGYQPAASGNAYCGIVTWIPSNNAVRESIICELLNPLVIGTEYYVSFMVSMGETYGGWGHSSLGMRFTNHLYTSVDPPLVDNFAHVFTTDVITDTSSWTIINGSFVADSNYTYLIIGNFFDETLIDTTQAYGYPGSHYYVDDICVSANSSTCLTSLGLNQLFTTPKTLIRIVDGMGRETEDKPNTLQIYIYSDGTTKKVFRVE